MMNALLEGARFIAIGVGAIAILMIVGYWATILGLAASDRNFRLRHLLGLDVTAANDRPAPVAPQGPSLRLRARRRTKSDGRGAPPGEQPPAPRHDGVGCARERAARDPEAGFVMPVPSNHQQGRPCRCQSPRHRHAGLLLEPASLKRYP